jgi:hypothetical protein
VKTPWFHLFACICALILSSCKDDFTDAEEDQPALPLPESTTTIAGQAALKVLPHTGGWMVLKETLQPQYLITQPRREISWMNDTFSETSNYKPAEEWSLIDAVVHPSGETSAVSVKLEWIGGDYDLRIKMSRIKTNGSVVDAELSQLPTMEEQLPVFPGCLDRVKLVADGEDVYVVARWRYNEVQAHRLSFEDNQFKIDWQKWVEPPSYVGTMGIIGGGYDNFRQGDRYFFVFADIDNQGNLYVAVPSNEELLFNHDLFFKENLSAGTDPANYEFGVAILTRFSSGGERLFAKREGYSRYKRLLNMRVGEEGVYLTGRVKTGQQSDSWDAWICASDLDGNLIYESNVDVRAGDMFWDVNPLPGGGVLAVGTTDYTQNPVGASVSDVRRAAAIVLDRQGKFVREIQLPQGPAARGSEAMYVRVLPNGSALFAGVHNAPGTHAAIYSDGFIAVRDFLNQKKRD